MADTISPVPVSSIASAFSVVETVAGQEALGVSANVPLFEGGRRIFALAQARSQRVSAAANDGLARFEAALELGLRHAKGKGKLPGAEAGLKDGVEALFEVVGKDELADAARFVIRGPVVTADAGHGDSIAVNGVCLTVVAWGDGWWEADVSDETFERTTTGSPVSGPSAAGSAPPSASTACTSSRAQASAIEARYSVLSAASFRSAPF